MLKSHTAKLTVEIQDQSTSSQVQLSKIQSHNFHSPTHLARSAFLGASTFGPRTSSSIDDFLKQGRSTVAESVKRPSKVPGHGAT